jgi:hypothetical protein
MWVYSGDPEFPGEIDDLDPNDEGKLTICVQKDTPVTLENVHGKITWGTVWYTYQGVKQVHEKWSDTKSPVLGSAWEIIHEDQGDDEPGGTNDLWLDEDGNAFGAMDVRDDKGHPFLVFEWQHPGGGHSSWSGYYIAKKFDGVQKSPRLTGSETERLGIGLTAKQVEKLATGGESSSDDDSGEEGDDDDDVESEGDDQDIQTGGKRKAVDTEEKSTGKRSRTTRSKA